MKKIKIDRQEAIYRIALAGISTAVALLFVGLSVLVRFSTVAFYIGAGCALMTPIVKKYYSSAIFAYIVSSVLGFLIAGDIFTVVGYVAYFGPMSIFLAICIVKKIKIFISLPIKILYMNGALALMYFVCGTIFIDPSIIGNIHYAVIAVVGTVALVLVDFAMQFIFIRMSPIMDKVLRTREKVSKENENAYEENDLNAFEGDSPFSEAIFEKKSIESQDGKHSERPQNVSDIDGSKNEESQRNGTEDQKDTEKEDKKNKRKNRK